MLKNKQKIVGIYRHGRELLYLEFGGRFYIKCEKSGIQDAVVLECNDTIAKGIWRYEKNGVLKLANDSNFEKIYYGIEQERKLSDDTLYVGITIPPGDSSFYEKFRYGLSLQFGGSIESNKSFIKVPKRNYVIKSLGLVIQDLAPNCKEGHKCYQRIYFRVFSDYAVNMDSNYINITLDNFNECFVEAMDMDNELLLFDGKNIHWRGEEYKRLSSR